MEPMNLPETLHAFEKSFLVEAIAFTNNNKYKASKLLGIKRTALIEKLKRFGIFVRCDSKKRINQPPRAECME